MVLSGPVPATHNQPKWRRPRFGGMTLQSLLGISRMIDKVNGAIGRWMAWAILLAVIISTVNALIRKIFDTSSNSWLEMQWVLFGAVFLLCAPWTLMVNEHIRIDVVSSHLKKRTRDWIDVIGNVVFLIPFTIIMIVTSIPFFWRSFLLNEQSLNAGGLAQWPGKFLVPLGFTLLFFQAVSELIKRIAIMRGELKDTTSGGGHHAAAEEEAARLLAGIKQ
jgi:TRAP-type mannitol/chloroaromatic compound transport system permease small subunit